MSARAFGAGWCNRLAVDSADEVQPAWKVDLNESWFEGFGRPVSRLLRHDLDRCIRVYEGWRADEIAATLDACVNPRWGAV